MMCVHPMKITHSRKEQKRRPVHTLVMILTILTYRTITGPPDSQMYQTLDLDPILRRRKLPLVYTFLKKVAKYTISFILNVYSFTCRPIDDMGPFLLAHRQQAEPKGSSKPQTSDLSVLKQRFIPLDLASRNQRPISIEAAIHTTRSRK